MKPVREKYDFTDGPILPQLSRFMLPILGALLLQAMYGAVDILVVGRFGTTAGILFSFMSYFNGHGQTVFVMAQGLAQTFIVRLPVSYVMSILPNTNLMLIGTAAPAATIFGIALNILYYRRFQKQMGTRHPL